MLSNNLRLPVKKSDGKTKKQRRRRSDSRTNVQSRRGRFDIYADAGKQALRDVNALRRFLNVELHYTDAIGNSVASSSTAAFVLLNGIQTGDTATTRSGQSVKSDGLDFRLTITGNALAVPLYERVLIVQDNQTNAAIFAIGDLLNATTVLSHYTVGGQLRFVVLFDETFTLVPSSQSYAITRVAKVNANSHVEYNTGNAGTVADITTHSIYLIHFSDQAVNTASLSYYSRYWFIDN